MNTIHRNDFLTCRCGCQKWAVSPDGFACLNCNDNYDFLKTVKIITKKFLSMKKKKIKAKGGDMLKVHGESENKGGVNFAVLDTPNCVQVDENGRIKTDRYLEQTMLWCDEELKRLEKERVRSEYKDKALYWQGKYDGISSARMMLRDTLNYIASLNFVIKHGKSVDTESL